MPWWLRLVFMFMAMRGENVESTLQQMGYMVRDPLLPALDLVPPLPHTDLSRARQHNTTQLSSCLLNNGVPRSLASDPLSLEPRTSGSVGSILSPALSLPPRRPWLDTGDTYDQRRRSLHEHSRLPSLSLSLLQTTKPNATTQPHDQICMAYT